MEWDLLSPERECIGFENYITAVSDPTLQKVFGNTFAYVFVCVPLMVIISLVLALMLNQIVKGRSFFRLIVFIPYVTSAVAISYVWEWMFMKNGGVINGILKDVYKRQAIFLIPVMQRCTGMRRKTGTAKSSM